MMVLISILEDDQRRLGAMLRVLAERLPEATVEASPCAWEFISLLEPSFAKVDLISLDHDLEFGPHCDDPGCGMDVVEWLLRRDPICPVVLHTANAQAGEIMESRLQGAGWHVRWTPPCMDLEWIGSYWIKRVCEMAPPGG